MRSPAQALASTRPGKTLALLALALGTSACQRGCLSTWLADRSGAPAHGVEAPRGSGGRDAAAAAFELTGNDCSGGLARCVSGRVETSVAAHVPGECPWTAAATCEAGCVTDGVEVVASGEIASVQLCNPREPVLRPLLATETTAVTICAEEVVSCADGIVRTCAVRGQPARPVAACAIGCAPGIGLEPGDFLTGDGPAAILCRRAHAERQ